MRSLNNNGGQPTTQETAESGGSWLADLIFHMEEAAKQFNACARMHVSRKNIIAAAVADHAAEIMLRFSKELLQANTKITNEPPRAV